MIRIFFIVALLTVVSYSFEISDDNIEFCQETIGNILNCEFEETINSTDSMSKLNRDEPLYPVLNLITMGLRFLDYNTMIDTAAFFISYNNAIVAIDRYDSIHSADSYSLTLRGFAYASYACFYLVNERYFAAIGKGLDAIKILENAKDMDSTNYDADFFLGFYMYAKGELRKRLWMVMFWYPGSLKEGRAILERSSRNGKIANIAAKMTLAGIYSREHKFSKADKYISELLKKYPESRFLFWIKAQRFEEEKRYREAAKEYGKLYKKYIETPDGYFNALETRKLQLDNMQKFADSKTLSDLAKETLMLGLCKDNKEARSQCKAIEKFVQE